MRYFPGRDACSPFERPSLNQLLASGVLPTRTPVGRKPVKRSPQKVEFDMDVQHEHGINVSSWSRSGGQGSAPRLQWAIDKVRNQWAARGKAIPTE